MYCLYKVLQLRASKEKHFIEDISRVSQWILDFSKDSSKVSTGAQKWFFKIPRSGNVPQRHDFIPFWSKTRGDHPRLIPENTVVYPIQWTHLADTVLARSAILTNIKENCVNKPLRVLRFPNRFFILTVNCLLHNRFAHFLQFVAHLNGICPGTPPASSPSLPYPLR